MNRIFRTLWNEVSRTYVAVAETVRGCGKPSSSCVDGTVVMARPAGQRRVLERRRPLPLALEARFMFDGAAVDTAHAAADAAVAAATVDATAAATTDASHAAAVETSEKTATATAKAADTSVVATATATTATATSVTEVASTATVHSVIVVDWTVADYQTLIAGLDPSIPVIVLQPGHSGLSGLAEALSGYSNLDAIYLVTEGGSGAIQLGVNIIDDAAIAADPTDIAAIGAALKPGGDLLLYGCSVASGASGEKFVSDLAAMLVDVDVAASTDRTGPTALGGDWDLEYSTGTIETVLPFTLAGMQDISHCLGCSTGDTNTDPTGSGYYAPWTELINSGHVVGWFSPGAYSALTSSVRIKPEYAVANYSANHGTKTGSFIEYASTSLSLEQAESLLVCTQALNDSDATVSAGSAAEATAIDSTVVNATSAVSLLDFTIADHSTLDTVATIVSQIVVDTSGSTADLSKMTFVLSGADGTFTGTYNSTTKTITFSGLPISVADGASETYAITAYFSDSASSSDVVDHSTIKLLVNASQFTTSSSGTAMVSGQASLTSSTEITVAATKLVYATSPTTSTSGSALSGQPVVYAVDARGNIDTDYVGTITLSEASAGALSGTTSINAAAGVATFSGVTYTATADHEAFTLSAASGSLASAATGSIDSNVVATKLVFTTEPAVTTLQSGDATSLSTVVVKAEDASGLVDTDYTASVALSLTTPADAAVSGSVDALTVISGDTDSSDSTVSVAASSGVATFVNLSLDFTTAASEAIVLHATSGSLTLADSTTLTVSSAPTVSLIALAGSSALAASATSASYTVTFSQAVTGVDASDFTLTATGSASGSIASVTGSGSTYTVTVSGLTGDGSLRLDLNGSGTGIANGSSIALAAGYTGGQSYTLDHTVPSAPATLDLATASDSGSSNTDKVTSVTTPTISGTAEAGSTVTLYDSDGTTVLGTTTADASGSWTVTTSALSAGTHSLTAKASDAAGNTSNASLGLAITIDTTAPTTTIAAAAFSSDTGSSSTDFITKTAAQTISGTLSANLASGETVYVSLDNGVTWNAASATVGHNDWSLAGVTLSASNTLKVRVSDIAGNYGSLLSQAYVLDTTAPTTSFGGLALSADTGASSSDFITKTAAQTISATLSGALAVSDIVYGSLDNGVTWTDITSEVSGTTLNWNGVTLLGSHTLLLRVVDAAGNDGTVRDQAYWLDTAAPSAPLALDLASASDSGYLSTDNVTQVTTPTVTGSAQAGSTVTLYDTNGTTLLGTATADGSGVWSITSSTLASGTHTLSAKATDTAGNVSDASAGISITIDTSAPATSSVTVPTNGTYYVGDALDFTVNFNEAVIVDTGADTPRIAIIVGATTRYAEYISGSGSSALVFRYVVPSGDTDSNGITVGALALNGGTLKDAAGNDAVTTLNSVGITASINVEGSQTSVTGVSSTTADGSYGAGSTITITVDFSSAVDVASSGGTPTLALGDGGLATYVSGSGTSTLVFSYTVATGQNSADLDYSSSSALALNGATIVDTSGAHQSAALTLATPGTAGSLGANKAIVIDTAAPSITVTTIAFSNDSGSSNTDLVTNGWAQTVSGTLSANLVAGETVHVSLDNGVNWAQATASGSSWSLGGVTLTGNGTLKVRVVDAAGNTGAAYARPYVLDTTAPTITIGSLALSADHGSSATDFITNTGMQTITATLSAAPAGTDIVYGSLDNGTTWTDITSMVSGTTLSWTGVTLAGSNTLSLRVTDRAGNNGAAASSQTYEIDTMAPTNAVTSASFSHDSGSSGSDFITNVAAQTISGTLSANLATGETVDVSLDNGSTWISATTSVGQHTWSLAGQTLSASSTLRVKVSDSAGNDGAVLSQAYVYDSAATVPTVDTQSTTQLTPVLTGSATLAAGETMTVSVGGATYAVVPVAGAWFLDLASAVPLSGTLVLARGNTYEVLASVSDLAGNTSNDNTGGELRVVPYAPTNTAVGIALSSDTGASSSDFITRTASQTLSGSLSAPLAAGDSVLVSFDNGANWQSASVAADLTRWTVSGTLAGSSTLLVKVHNAGGDGAVLAQVYGLDSTAPSAPGALVLLGASDNGSVSTPTISGSAEAGSTVTLYDSDGSTVVGHTTADGAGRWSITSAALSTGAHALTAKASDAAGNSSAASSALTVTIGTSAPPLVPVELVTPSVAAVPVAPATGATDPAATTDPAPLASFLTPATELALGRPTTTLLAALAPAATSTTPAADESAAAASATTPLTHGGGFAVIVASAGGSSADGLFVNRGLADLAVASGATSQFSIPADAFAASRADALVTLEARQANGQALPAWVNFNAASGTFEVQALPGVSGELTIRVVARDAQGHEAVITFKIRVGEKATRDTRHAQPERSGRAGLSEQIRLAARPHPALDRLARLLGGRPAA